VQECDRFYDFFLPQLAARGYEGHFAPKHCAPGLRYGFYSDGVAIFFKKSVFEVESGGLGLVAGNIIALGGEQDSSATVPHVLLPLVFKPLNQDSSSSGGDCGDGRARRLLVSTTHLKSKKGKVPEALRERQITYLLSLIASHHHAICQRSREDGGSVGVVLAGDFNCNPLSSNLCVPAVIKHTAPQLRSAYPLTSDKNHVDSCYTTWKRRGDTVTKHQIDYVWASEELKPTALCVTHTNIFVACCGCFGSCLLRVVASSLFSTCWLLVCQAAATGHRRRAPRAVSLLQLPIRPPQHCSRFSL